MSKKQYPDYVDATESPNPTHPSEILKDELEAQELTQKEFAKKIKMQPSMLNELVKGKRTFTPEIAVRIEQVLGIKAEFWVKMQTTYQIAMIRKKMKQQLKKSNIPTSKKNSIEKAL